MENIKKIPFSLAARLSVPADKNSEKRIYAIAQERGQSLPQMALAWLLHDPRVTSVIIGTSSVAQLNDNLQTLNNLAFTADELLRIDQILSREGIAM